MQVLQSLVRLAVVRLAIPRVQCSERFLHSGPEPAVPRSWAGSQKCCLIAVCPLELPAKCLAVTDPQLVAVLLVRRDEVPACREL